MARVKAGHELADERKKKVLEVSKQIVLVEDMFVRRLLKRSIPKGHVDYSPVSPPAH